MVTCSYCITTEQAPDDVSLSNLFINTKRNVSAAASGELLFISDTSLLHFITIAFPVDPRRNNLI